MLITVVIKNRNYMLRKSSKFKKFLKDIKFKKFERFNSSENFNGSSSRSSNNSKSSPKMVVFSKALSILISRACRYISVGYTIQ